MKFSGLKIRSLMTVASITVCSSMTFAQQTPTVAAEATPSSAPAAQPTDYLSPADAHPAGPILVVAAPVLPVVPLPPAAGSQAVGSTRFGVRGLMNQDLANPTDSLALGAAATFEAHSQNLITNRGTQPANASLSVGVLGGTPVASGSVDFGIQRNDNGPAFAGMIDAHLGRQIIDANVLTGFSIGYGRGSGSISFLMRMPAIGGSTGARQNADMILNLIGGRVVSIQNLGNYVRVQASVDASILGSEVFTNAENGSERGYILGAAAEINIHNRAQTGSVSIQGQIQDLYTARAVWAAGSHITPVGLNFTAQGAF